MFEPPMRVLKSDKFNKAYKKDLVTIVLVKSLFDVSKMGIDDKAGKIDIDFKYPDGYEEMIDNQINMISSKIQTTLENAMIRFPNNNFKEKSQIQIIQVLEWLSIENISVQLDVLASYLMYYAFYDRKVIYDDFKEYTDKEMYALVVNAMDEGGLPLMTKIKMGKTAREIISRIS